MPDDSSQSRATEPNHEPPRARYVDHDVLGLAVEREVPDGVFSRLGSQHAMTSPTRTGRREGGLDEGEDPVSGPGEETRS